MTTHYPHMHATVPADQWHAQQLTAVRRDAADATVDVVDYVIDADTAQDAERRTLTWIAYTFEDNMNGTWATATRNPTPGRWHVEVRWPVSFEDRQ